MGITNLNKFLSGLGVTKDLPSKDFSGTRIAVDALHAVFRYYSINKKSVAESCDLFSLPDVPEDRIETGFTNSMMQFVLRFLRSSITPVFVFDGPPSEAKARTMESRKQTRDKSREVLDALRVRMNATSPKSRDGALVRDYRAAYLGGTGLPGGLVSRFRKLLKHYGIPVVKAKVEGEKLCVMMVKEGLASAVFTGDTDVFAYGCPVVVKQFGEGWNTFKTLTMAEVLSSSKLTMEQFRDLCIMTGCDYNDSIPYVGPKTCEKLIRSFGTPESIPEEIIKKKSRGKGNLDCLQLGVCRNEFTDCTVEAGTLKTRGMDVVVGDPPSPGPGITPSIHSQLLMALAAWNK